MNLRATAVCIIVLATAFTTSTDASPVSLNEACSSDPYLVLRDAYRTADAQAAARAYTADAIYQELYSGADPILREGRKAIGAHFAELFATLGMGDASSGARADLDFKRTVSIATGNMRSDAGFYRLRVITPGAPDQTYHGRFAVQIRHCQFWIDTSADATEPEYERARELR